MSRTETPSVVIPATRGEAQERLREFMPFLGRYAARRNHVAPGHGGVSRLSSAIRHRLILEEEVIAEALGRYRFSTVEKFVQEILWRTYWKGWLELRPQVWRNYLEQLATLRQHLDNTTRRRVDEVCTGNSGVEVMDRFARELVATGYLHNHARMWWAGFWIHVERLPWELGADFFLRHLLDADPASNTLSWRWVAGLQTPGKTYLPRRSNLEKYLAPEWMQDMTGIEKLEEGGVQSLGVKDTIRVEVQPLPLLPSEAAPKTGRVGLWLHEDDCAIEWGALRRVEPDAIIAFTQTPPVLASSVSLPRRRHQYRVLHDACDRATRHFQCPVELKDSSTIGADLAAWAAAQKLDEVIAFSPFVGPVGDALPEICDALSARGIRLSLLRRPWDSNLFPYAKSGFFQFWTKVEGRFKEPALQPELIQRA